MILSQVLLARALRFRGMRTDSGGVHLLDLVRGMEGRYRFLEAPRTLSEYDPSKGITFQHGQYDGCVIDTLRIYSNAVAVETRANSEVADRFIDDLLNWTSTEFSFQLVPTPNLDRGYVSILEFALEKDISNLAPLNDLGDFITKRTQSYGMNGGTFQTTGLILHNESRACMWCGSYG